jgi:hypothetical protein
MRLFKSPKSPLLDYFPTAEVVGKVRGCWREGGRKLAVRLNSRIAKLSKTTLIWLISLFCLVMGAFSFHLLYMGIEGHRAGPPGFSTGATISQPATPLISDSTLHAIQLYRATHLSPPATITDSLTKK